MGPPQYPSCGLADQGPRRRFRRRRCLLKGCEQWFRPCHPQGRYCSAACQQAARRWRRWQASKHYRASAQGQERRREQSRRYRERQPRPLPPPAANGAETAPAGVAQHCEFLPARLDDVIVLETAPAGVAQHCAGQRPALQSADFVWRPCQRPGCYELFRVSARSPQQHFCSCSCRQALRRVLDREAHWRRRHRRPQARCRLRSRLPPNSS